MIVSLTLTLIQGHCRDVEGGGGGGRENENWSQISPLIDFDGISSAVETCWSIEPQNHFVI